MFKNWMIKSAFLILSVFTLLSFQTNVFGESVRGGLTKEEARDIVKAIVPDVKIISVEPAVVEGLWEVAMEGKGQKAVVYIDSAKKNVLIGQIINMVTKKNVTQMKFNEINRVDVSLIPLDDALLLGEAEAKNRVVVFDDPD
jgi:thiol:disulfide interchange protein DsbC